MKKGRRLWERAFFPTNLDRLFSTELGIDRFEYDGDVDALGIKK